MALSFDISTMRDRGTFMINGLTKAQISRPTVNSRVEAFPDLADPLCANVDVQYDSVTIAATASNKESCIPVTDATVSITVSRRSEAFGTRTAPTAAELAGFVGQVAFLAIRQLTGSTPSDGAFDATLPANYYAVMPFTC